MRDQVTRRVSEVMAKRALFVAERVSWLATRRMSKSRVPSDSTPASQG